MKIVIDIPEDEYKRLKVEGMFGNITTFKQAIKSVPLEPCGDISGTIIENIYKCPCGYGWDISKAVRHHYCPNCGRKSGR